MSNTLQQSTLLYTEREIKGSYWAALLCSLHATSHTLNVFSKAFYSTLRRKQRDHIAEVQCLIYFSPILFTQKGKQRDHIAEGTASFDPPLTSLVALQSEILSVMSWSRTRDKAFSFPAHCADMALATYRHVNIFQKSEQFNVKLPHFSTSHKIWIYVIK